MYSTIAASAQCSAGRHKLTEFSTRIENGKLICKGCRKEFGNRYDGEWTNRDIQALLGDYRAALFCLCGGPTCGPNARKVYAFAYPTLGQLFA